MAFKIDLNYPVLKESNLKGLPLKERGKVRDIYDMGDSLLMVTTDRISTHDVVYEDCIPHKGYGLTATPVFVFKGTDHIVPNHFLSNPDPNVMVVQKAETYPIEVVIRGIITGSAWKSYVEKGEVCGIKLPPGLKKNQMLDEPIITPTTKEKTGHDMPLTDAEAAELVGRSKWEEMKRATREMYAWGREMASKNNSFYPDTKLEFGKNRWYEVILLDEALTHDSSRMLLISEWKNAFREGRDPDWIDKQYVRDFAESLGFTGDGPAPRLPDHIRLGAAERVLKVYEMLTGAELPLPEKPPTDERIERNLRAAGLI
jgi:phosphoribosylaminoimidazole-succinocarboxamide synthase